MYISHSHVRTSKLIHFPLHFMTLATTINIIIIVSFIVVSLSSRSPTLPRKHIFSDISVKKAVAVDLLLHNKNDTHTNKIIYLFKRDFRYVTYPTNQPQKLQKKPVVMCVWGTLPFQVVPLEEKNIATTQQNTRRG